MQLANILLRLAGDTGNTVPKYDVTPSEIAVLRHIHGDEAVIDVEPTGDVKRTSRAERERLSERYGRIGPNGTFVSRAVDDLFPGVATRVFEDLDELGLPEEFFKAEKRMTAAPAPVIAADVVKPAKPKAARAPKSAPVEPEPAADEPAASDTDEAGEDDGIGDMPDQSVFA